MTSIDDVAREVGVSTATVSRALRGLPRVSEATRTRVLETAQRLGYVPSPHAARLASGRTATVAVVVPFITRWFFSTVVDGAERTLRAQGFEVLLYNLAGDPATRERVLSTHLLTKRVDAVLLLSLTPTRVEVEWLTRNADRVVTLGTEVEHWSSVRIDDRLIARTAVEHLLGLGHRRIGMINGHIDEGLQVVTPRDRGEAYHQVLAEHGIDTMPDLEGEGGFRLEGGYRVGRRLLDRDDPPTAVFCASDEMAIGLMRACREAGVRVPEDLSVVGVDDHEMSAYLALTTVRQPVREQGEAAARQVLALLEAPDGAPPPVEHLTLPTELVVRGSTAPLPPA